MRLVGCAVGSYDIWLLALALTVCACGGFVGQLHYARAATHVRARRIGWLFLSSITVGASVWCTHFITMLAHEVPVPVSFDPTLTLLSLLVAIGGVALSGFIALNKGLVPETLAGVLLGLSIAAMHYVGMIAYRVEGLVEWNGGLVALFIATAITFTCLAMVLGNGGPEWRRSSPSCQRW